MTRYALEADNSANMEKLRAVRSYNDLVFVLMPIKTKAISIRDKALRSVVKGNDFTFDADGRAVVAQFYQDLFDLFVLELEVLFARSTNESVIHESKQNKVKILLDLTYNTIIEAENAIYAALKSFLNDKIPSSLHKFTVILRDFLTKVLSYSGVSLLNLPSPDSQSIFSYLIFKRICAPSGFILSDVLFCIKAISNNDGTYSYTLSFPSKVGEDQGQAFQFSNQRKMLSIVKSHLVQLFEISSIKELPRMSKNRIKTLVGVYDVELSNGILTVKLESGLTGAEINNIITKLLSTLTSILGIDNLYLDAIHKMVTLSDGTRAIQFMLMDKTVYDTNALDDLRTLLNLKPTMFRALKTAAGVQ